MFWNDVVKKLRNFENKCKILRFFEIRSDSISARRTLQQGANKPEGRLRSTWNEIAIPIANSGFPSVSRRFYSTRISVDEAGAIGANGDCEKTQKLINCAQRWDEALGIPGTFVT